MNRVRKFLALAAILMVGASILGAPTQARATFSVQVYDNGVLSATTFVQPVGSSIFFSDTTTDFSIIGSATIQQSGNAQLHVSYNDTVETLTSGTNTLTLLITNTNYLLPSGSLVTVSSSGGGSYKGTTGDTIVGNTMGFLDSHNLSFGNGLGTTIAVGSPSGVVSPNTSSTPVSSTGTVTSDGGSQSLVFVPGTGTNNVYSSVPFSLTNVSFFTFSGVSGDEANISNSVSTANATVTPAPDGLVLVLAGIPFLGFGIWLRRRQGRLIAV